MFSFKEDGNKNITNDLINIKDSNETSIGKINRNNDIIIKKDISKINIKTISSEEEKEDDDDFEEATEKYSNKSYEDEEVIKHIISN